MPEMPGTRPLREPSGGVIKVNPRSGPSPQSDDSRHSPEDLPRDKSTAAAIARGLLIQCLLLEAIRLDVDGDRSAGAQALERALERTEHDRPLLIYLVASLPAVLEHHAGRRTSHRRLISEILDVLAGIKGLKRQGSELLRDPLTDSETRVLRLLVTNLSQQEIGRELFVSVNTIKTHVRRIYAKLDVQTRSQAVQRARHLGLLSLASR